MARTSDKQEKILEFLNRYIEENGYPPAVREICAAVGLKSTATVSYHMIRTVLISFCLAIT